MTLQGLPSSSRFEEEIVKLFQQPLSERSQEFCDFIDSPFPNVPEPWSGNHAVFCFGKGSIESQSKFYVALEENRSVVRTVQQTLQKLYSDDVRSIGSEEDIYCGMACVARCTVDGQWYRGIVRDVGIVEALVGFIDRGNSEFVTFQKLKPLFGIYRTIPPLVLPCQIFCVEKTELWRERIDGFVELLQGMDFQFHIEFNYYPPRPAAAANTHRRPSLFDLEPYRVSILNDAMINLCEQYCYRQKQKHMPKDVWANSVGAVKLQVEMDENEGESSDEGGKVRRKPNKPSAFRKDKKPEQRHHHRHHHNKSESDRDVVETLETRAEKHRHHKEAKKDRKKEKSEKLHQKALHTNESDYLDFMKDLVQTNAQTNPVPEANAGDLCSTLRGNGELSTSTPIAQSEKPSIADAEETGSGTTIVGGDGVIDVLFASWGIILSPDIAEPVVMSSRLLRSLLDRDLAASFLPGDHVMFDAYYTSSLENPSSLNSSLAAFQNFSTRDDGSASYEINESLGYLVATKVNVTTLQSDVERVSGSGVITTVDDMGATIVPFKSPFRKETAGPIRISRNALHHVPGKHNFSFSLSQLLEVGQIGRFIAVKDLKASPVVLEALSFSVGYEPRFEGIGKVLYSNRDMGVGFLAFFPEAIDCDEVLKHQRFWNKHGRGQPFLPHTYGKFIVRFNLSQICWPYLAEPKPFESGDGPPMDPVPPAPTEINLIDWNTPITSSGNDEALPDGSQLNSASEPAALAPESKNIGISSDLWKDKWFRFRASSAEGGKPWDWNATFLEPVLPDLATYADVNGHLVLPTSRIRGGYVVDGKVCVSDLMTAMNKMRQFFEELIATSLSCTSAVHDVLSVQQDSPQVRSVDDLRAPCAGSKIPNSKKKDEDPDSTLMATEDIPSELAKIANDPALLKAAGLLFYNCPKLFGPILGKHICHNSAS